MRYAFAASAILGAVAAAPQMINIEAALDVPTPTILGPELAATADPVSYNPTAAASIVASIVKVEGVEKRATGDCAVQPSGTSTVPGSGSLREYQDANGVLRSAAQAATPPSGYSESFKDLSGSSQQIGYLTYKNIETGSYDVQACADFCNSEKYCLGFNLYYERDPSVDPGVNCPNPAPITNLKCAIYGYNVAKLAATNTGEDRGPADSQGNKFNVIIVGSNGYSKTTKDTLPTIPDFNAGTKLPAAINAPLDNGYDTYAGMKLFNNNPYDPALCAAACKSQTSYNIAHPAKDGSYKTCNFFTSYVLTQNDVPLGTYCALYSRSWDATYAVNKGYTANSGKYQVLYADSYAITNPVAPVKPTKP
jgi:hypothetical protein